MKKSIKTRGILLIGLGHENYSHMAEVLAASIKVNDPDISITVVSNANLINPELFNQIIVSDPKLYNGDKKEFIKAKLHIFELTPYDETIFLDVDQIILPGKKLSTVFDEMKDIDFTMSNTGKSTMSIWADIKEVNKIYGPGEFWNFHSEFIYFKKTPAVKTYFETAIKIYNSNKIKSAHKFAGGSMADELAFQCASIVTGLYPHIENWLPNFWFDRNHKEIFKYPYQLAEKYTAYSIGGNTLPEIVRTNYNNLAKHYFAILKLQNPYQAIAKNRFLPERQRL